MSTITTPYPDLGDISNGIVNKDSLFPSKLTDDQITFLSSFLDPTYLQMKTIMALSERFVEESSLELHKFLKETISEKLAEGLTECDKRDGLDEDTRQGKVPSHTAGASPEASEKPWVITGPPH